MDNLENAISGILSDPDAMEKIRELSRGLGLAPQQNPTPKENSANPGGFDLSSLASAFSQMSQPSSPALSGGIGNGLSPDILSIGTKLMPLMSSFNREDESTVLLNALRPFLSKQKCQRLDEASKILRIMRLLPAIKDMGIFQ